MIVGCRRMYELWPKNIYCDTETQLKTYYFFLQKTEN